MEVTQNFDKPQERLGCVYKEVVGCSVCTHVLFRTCPKFRSFYVRDCAAALMPFKFTTINSKSGPFVPDSEVVFSYLPILNVESVKQLYCNTQYVWLADRLKSMAVRVAMSSYGGRPVEYETLESVVSKCFAYNREEADFAPGVHFVELFSKGLRDFKILSMVDSFINHVVQAGGRVFMLTSCYQPTVCPGWYELRPPQVTSVLGNFAAPGAEAASVVSSDGGDVSDPHGEF